MDKRRTNPAFLSNNEADRERRRTEEVVRSIVGNKPICSNARSNIRREQVTRHARWNPIKRVGETNNFIIEFNYQDKLIAICGKEFLNGSPFKLRFSISESKTIINFLAKARNMMGNKLVTRIGETNNFVIDYDGNQKLAMLFENPTQKFQFNLQLCPIKLGFNETETTAVINLLLKARSLF